jgi:hypothetical protein
LAKEYDRKNPAFAQASLGVASNHSSGQRSVSPAENAQADDAINDVATKLDPNISGNAPTEDCYTWMAGKMDGWKENDDYRDYFERSIGSNGMLACDCNDGDYDDNGGYPTAVGHGSGVHGTAGEAIGTEFGSTRYTLAGIYQRRL